MHRLRFQEGRESRPDVQIWESVFRQYLRTMGLGEDNYRVHMEKNTMTQEMRDREGDLKASKVRYIC